MNIVRKTPEGVNKVSDVVQDTGNTDYLKDGVIYKNAPIKTVMILDETNLSDLDGYTPGAIAYTAGFDKMWQLSVSDEWVEM